MIVLEEALYAEQVFLQEECDAVLYMMEVVQSNQSVTKTLGDHSGEWYHNRSSMLVSATIKLALISGYSQIILGE